MSEHKFYSLNVRSVKAETADTNTVTFDIPEDLKSTFAYKQGQYLTLKFNLNGEEVRRAYSMSSSPMEDGIAVTVKRVKGGLVSNHIGDKVQAGTQIEVMRPEGRFYTKLSPEQKKTYYLFGAGSGITPLMSILKTVLEEEPKSTVYLFYGNRKEDGIIFQSDLGILQKRYAGQLVVEHILSQPKKEKGGWFSKGKTTWTGKVGRLGASNVKEFIKEHPARSKDSEYFICGPGDMITSVERTLKNMDLPAANIHAEHFTSNVADEDKVKGAAGSLVTAHLNGETVQVNVPSDKTILDVLIKEGYDPPYSCTSGACSTCLAKTLKGSVKMDVHYAIDDDEIAQGFILTCQSHPMTAEVEVTYEV